MTLYMLDTNIASAIMRGREPVLLQRLVTLPIENVMVSGITEAELLYGLIKHGNSVDLAKRITAFLRHVTVRDWNSHASLCYGQLRTACDARGKSLSSMDMLIAAHALAVNAVLVSRDNAFANAGIAVEVW